eukprot:snap_masked-scaffold_12-processed-gene-8.29-mRNA-1 protein AED:1.00 eAED:1.00 QI:0/-1/0/0/-1/1/1/0/547
MEFNFHFENANRRKKKQFQGPKPRIQNKFEANANSHNIKVLTEADRIRKRQEELHKLRELQREEAEKERENEERLAGGIVFKRRLKPFPMDSNNSNRVRLPVSILNDLHNAQLLSDSPSKKQILSFQVLLKTKAQNGTFLTIGKTYAGVDSFDGEEGTLGLPPKTALSLVKDKGLEILEKEVEAEIKLTKLDSHKRIFMSLRPKGDGFPDNLSLDLKTLLESTLQDHFIISKHDYIPIFVQEINQQLILKVEEIYSLDANDKISNFSDEGFEEETFLVIDTEIEVDLLPSENDQKEMDEREGSTQRKKSFLKIVKQRAAVHKKMETAVHPEVVNFKVKFPTGSSIRVRVDRHDSFHSLLEVVFDEFCRLYSKVDELPFEVSEAMARSKFAFILKDGKRRLEEERMDESLVQLGYKGKYYMLRAEFKRDAPKRTEKFVDNGSGSENQWEKAVKTIAKATLPLQQEDPGVSIAGKEKASFEQISIVYNLLRGSFDIEENIAQTVSQQYSSAVFELQTLGFGERMKDAVPLLIRYNGRMDRVINGLLGYD